MHSELFSTRGLRRFTQSVSMQCMMTLGDELRTARETQHLSLPETEFALREILVKGDRVSYSTIGRVERGEKGADTLSTMVLVGLIAVLEMDPDNLGPAITEELNERRARLATRAPNLVIKSHLLWPVELAARAEASPRIAHAA